MELILSHEIARRILFLFLEKVLKFYSIHRRFCYEALWIFEFHIPHKIQITCFRSISFHRLQEKNSILSGRKGIFHERYLVASIIASLKTSNSFWMFRYWWLFVCWSGKQCSTFCCGLDAMLCTCRQCSVPLEFNYLWIEWEWSDILF